MIYKYKPTGHLCGNYVIAQVKGTFKWLCNQKKYILTFPNENVNNFANQNVGSIMGTKLCERH